MRTGLGARGVNGLETLKQFREKRVAVARDFVPVAFLLSRSKEIFTILYIWFILFFLNIDKYSVPVISRFAIYKISECGLKKGPQRLFVDRTQCQRIITFRV